MKTLIAMLVVGVGLGFVGLRLYQETAAGDTPADAAGFAGGRGRGGNTLLVETGRLTPHVFISGREFSGELQPFTRVDVIPRATGYLQAIRVEQADPVETGQLLAEIDGADIEQQIIRQEAALAVAVAGANRELATLENLRAQVARNRSLLDQGLVARDAVEEIESRLRVAEAQYELAGAQVDQARASLEELHIQFERTRVYSPMRGVVAERHVDPGALVGQNTSLVTLVDLTRLKTLVSVPEASIGGIGPGIDAEVRVDALPGRSFQGQVTRISPMVNRETRSLDVEVQIDNAAGTLRPGMFARVSVGAAGSLEAPSVPRSALITRRSTQGVFLLPAGGDPEAGNVAEFREIQVGRNEDGWIEVLGGLTPEDVFISTGAQNVNEGDRVRLAPPDPAGDRP